jgi:acyl dehydratase
MSATTLDWAAVQVGDELPALAVELTPTVVVAAAIASRDFMPVHHDRDYAQSQGAPNIFTNILTDTGFCSRFLTDWAGPEAMVKRLAIRLGTPAFAGSTLTYTGTVTGKSQAGAEGHVEVAFRAATDMGEHLSGTAVVGLPLRGGRA